jgi:hypothetical protein
MLRGVGITLDAIKKLVAFDYPLTGEAALMMTRFVPCDSDATVSELGVPFRPVEQTLTDAIQWLVEAGHLAPQKAGRLAG